MQIARLPWLYQKAGMGDGEDSVLDGAEFCPALPEGEAFAGAAVGRSVSVFLRPELLLPDLAGVWASARVSE
jgi:hypothetical protein